MQRERLWHCNINSGISYARIGLAPLQKRVCEARVKVLRRTIAKRYTVAGLLATNGLRIVTKAS